MYSIADSIQQLLYNNVIILVIASFFFLFYSFERSLFCSHRNTSNIKYFKMVPVRRLHMTGEYGSEQAIY